MVTRSEESECWRKRTSLLVQQTSCHDTGCHWGKFEKFIDRNSSQTTDRYVSEKPRRGERGKYSFSNKNCTKIMGKLMENHLEMK